ncbi:MAG: phosphoribosylanthranilate isomerase [Alphaproteobacteria bacterium]|nr:phosphoribosylanthranilate isomerase [Rhodobiaceae bacterium]MBO6544063.1 phosphoribosylanthranilate isomerase [Alphaproteobacteria bacterium]MBO6629223.1 phosphoribosylanthranilate isomerase [Alphaproteobacteria bacterium]MDF1627845.1 phosphoribosylanthranilate isomerase [Parvibaculaceae bacterium]
MAKPLVKICGLSTPETLQAAIEAGVDYVGFVFFERSPRYVSVETAAHLRALMPPAVTPVALLVDAQDAFIDTMIEKVQPGLLQLHGHETPERVAAIKTRTGLPVMKVLSIATADDVAATALYENVADLLMFDAKPPKSMPNALPGGNALSFDWSLIADISLSVPWMLSGGLNPDNVAEAIIRTGASMVDVSSGVESAPGQKDVARMRAFIQAAKG